MTLPSLKQAVQAMYQTLCPALWEGDVLLRWAVSTSLLVLAVLALRLTLGRGLSCRWRYALWAVVLVRALLPLHLPLALPLSSAQVPSLIQLAEQPLSRHISDLNAPATPIYDQVPRLPEGEVTGSSLSRVPGDPSRGLFTQYTRNGEEVVTTVPIWSRYQHYLYLWTLGAGLFLAVLAGSNLRFALRLRRARRPFPARVGGTPIYTAGCVATPCLFGLFRPAIYLPPQVARDGAALGHVLAHELTHRRHGDHIWSALRCAALALHWYDPLVWLAVVLSRRDGELACDEGAVARLGEGERLPYGRTLVGLVAGRSFGPGHLLQCSTTMSPGKKALRRRIEQLARDWEEESLATYRLTLAGDGWEATYRLLPPAGATTDPWTYVLAQDPSGRVTGPPSPPSPFTRTVWPPCSGNSSTAETTPVPPGRPPRRAAPLRPAGPSRRGGFSYFVHI